MDDIILDNSDIEDVISNVSITDLIYTDEGRLKLSNDQIKAEVANLMPPNMPLFKLKQKTDIYFNLFNSPIDDVPFPNTLIPIIDVNKYMLEDEFKPVFHYKIDKELDEQNHIVGQLFEEFIQNYRLANRNREESYVHTCRNLYNLFKPFVDSSEKPIQKETDALSLRHDSFLRLIPPVKVDVGNRPDVIDEAYLEEGRCPQGRHYLERNEYELLYKGDCPKIKGYFNIVNKKTALEFNISTYLEHLKTLKQDDKVFVYFNLPVYDYHHREVVSVEGRVISNDELLVISLDKNVQLENFNLRELEFPVNKYVPFFVYAKSFEPKFHKGLFKTTNVKIFFDNHYQEKYIKPQTWAEYFYATGKNIAFKNAQLDMYPHYKNSLTILSKDVPLNLYKAIHTYTGTSKFFNFTKYSKYLQYYDSYDVSTIDNDLIRFQYLNSQHDHGMLYILEHSYKQVLDDDQIDDILKDLKQKSNQIQRNKSSIAPGQLAKRYLSIEEMNADNNKTIYVDKEFDKTEYNLKKKFTTKQQLLEALNYNEFEVDCILAGKRPLKEGDYCIVGSHKKTYKWAKVSNEFMWVKTSGVIHESCEKSLPSYEDLTKPNTMVLDSFDNLCKKTNQAKNNREYQELTRLIGMLEEMKTINDMAQLKEFLIAYVDICKSPKIKKSLSMIGYVDKYSDDYYDYNLENMFMNFEFDAGPTIMNYDDPNKIKNRTILDILCQAFEIKDLSYDDEKYINTYIDASYPESDVIKDIENETSEKVKQYKKVVERIESQHKKDKEKFLKEVQKKHNEILENVKNTNWKQYYHKKILLCAGMLSLIIMIKYPNIVIKKLVPGCVKYFSYKGAPLLEDENAQRSLTKYFACVLKSLYQPNDLKFGLFENMDNNYKSLLEVIKKIVEQKYDVKAKLAEVKDFKEEENYETEVSYNVLNIFYRPCFDFVKSSYTNPIIEYLRLIHEKISSSQITKYNLVNMPLLRNACCAELLVNYSNFYDYFESEEIKKLKSQISKIKTNASDKNIIISAQQKIKFERLFKITKDASQTPKVIPWKEKEISKMETHDEQWWENLHLNNILRFDYLKTRLKSQNIDFINRFIIQIKDINNVTSLRNLYANYLRGSLLTLISKLTSLYTFKKKEKVDESSKFVRLLKSLYELNVKDVLSNISKELKVFNQEIKYDSSSQDVTNALHNIIWYTNVFLNFVFKAIWISTDNAYDDDLMKLSLSLEKASNKVFVNKIFDMIDLIMDDMTDYINLNYFDVNDLKKEVELLREKRKQEIMSKYSEDREERNQQKILKTMGLDILNEEVFEEKIETKEPTLIEGEKEYEDHEIDVKGENADEDVDHDGFD